VRKNELAALAMACSLVSALIVPDGAVGQAPEPAWAQAQQAALAEDILSGDEDRRQRAVFVAEALGPSRMSEEVRVALITLLEQCIDAQHAARRQGIPLNDAVDFEFFVSVAVVVATLNDPRAIPAPTQVGNFGYSRHAARGLASFGEQALPAILKVFDTPGASIGALAYNMDALSMMVEDIGAKGLSMSARDHIVGLARDGLRSQDGDVLLSTVDLAVALNEPELVQTVAAFSRDSGQLVARGVSPTTANLLRKRATRALARTSSGGLTE